MPLELTRGSDDDGTIPVRELKVGQVAEIVQWPGSPNSVGEVVMRNPRSIVGITLAHSYNSISESRSIRVRVLPNGTQFVLRHNE
jgi:hypothetical protein